MRGAITVLVLCLAFVACDSEEPEPTPEATPEATACEAAEFAPTYLPWVKGNSIPEPETFTAQLNTTQHWTTPEGAKNVVAVDLVRRYQPWEDHEDFQKVPVRGTEGRLVWIGDPGVGQLSLQWSEGEEICDNYGIYLTLPGASQRKAEAEMARISKSLR
jgi:hypothetical protein